MVMGGDDITEVVKYLWTSKCPILTILFPTVETPPTTYYARRQASLVCYKQDNKQQHFSYTEVR